MQSEQASRDGPGEGLGQGTRHPPLGGGVRTAKDAGCSHPSPQSSPSRGEGVLSPSCAIPSPASAPAASTPDHSHASSSPVRPPSCSTSPVWRHPRPPAVLRLPPPRDRRPARPRRTDRGPKAGHPGRLQRSLFASLRDDRAAAAHARASTPASPSASASTICSCAGNRCCIRATSSTCRWRKPQYVRDRAATALGPDAAIMLRHDPRDARRPAAPALARRAVRLRSARRADGDDRDRACRRRLPRSARRAVGESNAMGRPCRPHRGAGAGKRRSARRHRAVPPHRRANPRRLWQRADRSLCSIGRARTACG